MKSIGGNSSKNEAAAAPAKRGTAGGGLCLTSRPAGRGTRMPGAGPDMSSAMSRCTGQIRPDVQMRYLSVLQSLFAFFHGMCSKLRRSGRVALSWKTRRGPGSVLKASTKWRSTSLSVNDTPCNRQVRASAHALQVSSYQQNRQGRLMRVANHWLPSVRNSEELALSRWSVLLRPVSCTAFPRFGSSTYE